ncbi:hypothetical protein RhiTH_004619 [Rhizoctonia solani]
MSYNDSNAFGTQDRFDSTRQSEFANTDNTRRDGLNDNTTSGYDNTKFDLEARSDNYTSGNAGSVGSNPTGFTDSTHTSGRNQDTYGSTTAGTTGTTTTPGNYGSSTTGDKYGSSRADNFGSSETDNHRTTNTYGSSNTSDNYGSTDRTRGTDLNTRTGGHGSSNTTSGYSNDNYGPTTGVTGATGTTGTSSTTAGYGAGSTTDNYGTSHTDRHGKPNTDNFGNTDRDTYGRGTNATGTDEFNTGRGNDHKPTMGEKVKGTMETIQGKMTGKPEVVERGKERKAGNLDYH